MKRQLRKLGLISKFVDVNDFYTITIWYDEIKLQGEYSNEKVQKYAKIFGPTLVEDSGFIKLEKNNIRILFT